VRFCFLEALPKRDAVTVTTTLYKIFCTVGFPQIIQSDNGKEFKNDLLAGLTQAAAIDHHFLTPYHPQGNGLVERFVHTFKTLTEKLIEGQVDKWDESLHMVQL
jgi:transposase InsO family protein